MHIDYSPMNADRAPVVPAEHAAELDMTRPAAACAQRAPDNPLTMSFFCCRDRNHDGLHIATMGGGRYVCATWDDDRTTDLEPAP